MAGHSKWKNIQHRKGAQDAKRSKIFTKVGIELQVASKKAGTDPSNNPQLRSAISRARSVNMPNDMINRLINKSDSSHDQANYKNKTYEGFCSGGIAIMVECLTDNINRTVSDIRYCFARNGATLGTDGSVSWMFEHKGIIKLSFGEEIIADKAQLNQTTEQLIDFTLETQAMDFNSYNDRFVVITPKDLLFEIKNQFDQAFEQFNFEADHYWIAKKPLDPNKDDLAKLLNLCEALDDLMDVQKIMHNVRL